MRVVDTHRDHMPMNRNDRRPSFREDRILTFTNRGEESRQLMEFILASMPDAKRNDVKKWLRYGHLMVAGVVRKVHMSRMLTRATSCGSCTVLTVILPDL